MAAGSARVPWRQLGWEEVGGIGWRVWAMVKVSQRWCFGRSVGVYPVLVAELDRHYGRYVVVAVLWVPRFAGILPVEASQQVGSQRKRRL